MGQVILVAKGEQSERRRMGVIYETHSFAVSPLSLSLFSSSALRFVSNPPKRVAEKEGRRGGCREGGAERRNGRNYGGSKRWKRKRARERRIHRAAITKCLAQRERERELSCIDMRSRVFLVYSNYTIYTYLRPPFSIRWWRWVRGPSGSSRPE